MYFSAAISGFLARAGLIIAIGSQNAFVFRQGLKRNYVGMVVAICSLGDMSMIILGVTGMGSIVGRWPILLKALRFGGAAFLVIYGLAAARRAWRGNEGLSSGVSGNEWRSPLWLHLSESSRVLGHPRAPWQLVDSLS